MAEIDPVALGAVIRTLRKKSDRTQEQFGRDAGYNAGAGVSISRIESGLALPTPDRMKGIAETVGLTVSRLEALSATSSNDGQAERLTDRETRVNREISEQKTRLEAVTVAHDDAAVQARESFLLPFAQFAALIDNAEPPDSPPALPSSTTPAGAASAAAEQASDVAGLTGILGGGAAATAMFFNTARPLAGGLAWGGRALGAGVIGAALFAVAGTAYSVAVNSKRQRSELARELDRKEAELAAARPVAQALLRLVPQATDLLAYIDRHAAHAAERWIGQLGEPPLDWNDLDQPARTRYLDFVQISAAEIKLETIAAELSASEADDDLPTRIANAEARLTYLRTVIQSRV